MISINNYGLLWDRNKVHFGWKGSKGTLLGHRNSHGVVDFREQIGIYVLYDKYMKVVYVGQAGNGNAALFDRLKQHTNDHLWNRWESFSWFGFKKINESSQLNQISEKVSGTISDSMNEIEGLLIKIMEPTLNKKGANWKDAQEFFQEVDENAEEISIYDVYSKQEELEELLKKISKRLIA